MKNGLVQSSPSCLDYSPQMLADNHRGDVTIHLTDLTQKTVELQTLLLLMTDVKVGNTEPNSRSQDVSSFSLCNRVPLCDTTSSLL
ncbi:uncharacterized protein V6R79_025825 [Siganus canaliculatus]